LRAKKYVQTRDGDKIVVGEGRSRLHKIACCDCGLVHVLKFKLEGSVITFRAYRDNRATGQRRRREHEFVPRKRR